MRHIHEIGHVEPEPTSAAIDVPPQLERQVGVSVSPLDGAPGSPRMEREEDITPEQMAAAREAFPSAEDVWGGEAEPRSEEELRYQAIQDEIEATPERIVQILPDGFRWYGKDGEGDHESDAAYVVKHKRALLFKNPPYEMDLQEENGIVYDMLVSDEVPFAYWNQTLQGYIIRPTKEHVLRLNDLLWGINIGI